MQICCPNWPATNNPACRQPLCLKVHYTQKYISRTPCWDSQASRTPQRDRYRSQPTGHTTSPPPFHHRYPTRNRDPPALTAVTDADTPVSGGPERSPSQRQTEHVCSPRRLKRKTCTRTTEESYNGRNYWR